MGFPPDPQPLIQRSRYDPQAFHKVYHAYLPRVFAYVAYRVMTREDAEDITAEVFVQVVDNMHQFEWRGDGSFTAWLFRIAHNAVVSHMRRHALRQQVPLDDLPELSSETDHPEDAVLAQERFVRLQRAISRLSPRKQEVVTLRYFGGLRNQEIAVVLGVDERTVAAHLSRALAELHAVMVNEHITGV